MARAPKTAQTTELVNWESQMEAEATVAAAVVANIGGNVPRFSIRGGQLTIDDTPVPGNHMAAVVVDSVLENTFYEGEYDANNTTPPTCFALGRDDATMAPHQTVVDHDQAQNAQCRGCPMNAFGTAERGKGKACKNRVRLMLVNAGRLSAEGRLEEHFTDPDHYTNYQAALFSVPPTSIGGWATYVKQLANSLKMPPHGVITKISVRPDPKVQVRVSFEPIMKAPSNLFKALLEKHAEVKPLIEQPYNLDQEEAEAPAQAARGKPKGATRPPVKKGKY